MDLLPIIFITVVFGFAFLSFRKPRLQLKELKAGKYGEFDVDCHFNFEEIIIAVDRKRRFLYFIDIRIPEFDRKDRIISYMDGRFRCRFEDITSINATEDNKNLLTITINFDENFKMYGLKKKWQSLWVITRMDSQFLNFKKELSSIPFEINQIKKDLA